MITDDKQFHACRVCIPDKLIGIHRARALLVFAQAKRRVPYVTFIITRNRWSPWRPGHSECLCLHASWLTSRSFLLSASHEPAGTKIQLLEMLSSTRANDSNAILSIVWLRCSAFRRHVSNYSILPLSLFTAFICRNSRFIETRVDSVFETEEIWQCGERNIPWLNVC